MAKLRRRANRPGDRRRRSLAEALEPRILLSADLPGLSADTALASHDDGTNTRHELLLGDESPGITPEQHQARRELVFVDEGIEGYEQLIADLRDRDAGDSLFEIHVLSQESDGLAQIGDVLAGRNGDVDALHVVSHGTEGGVQIGATWLTTDSLTASAASLAGWGDALSADADLLLYGCNLAESSEGQKLVDGIATLTGADVAASRDLTGASALGGDWELEYASGSIEARAAFGGASSIAFHGVLGGTAIWAEDGSAVPETSPFDGASFGAEGVTANVGGEWQVMTGAASPTRDEMIVFGVDIDDQLSGQMWNGTSWSALPFNGQLPTVARSDRQGFDVAYDSVSGDAMLVYNNGRNDFSGISYRTWDGTTWSGPVDIALPSSDEPDHIRLAADPGSGEMILVAGTDANRSYALVWDGANWGNAAMLHDGSGAQGNTDVAVTYEQQSGQAMLVYAKSSDSLYYRMWTGSTWGAEGSIDPPGGATAATGQPLWTSLASDPGSDRIALGVITGDRDAWLAVWDGSSWQPSERATLDSPHTDRPNVAVAFESQSGRAIAVYATPSSLITYRTWTTGGGWTNEQLGPDLGGVHIDAVTLDADPFSNQVMLSVLKLNRSMHFVAWNAGSWGTPSQQEVDTGTNRGKPFVFLWKDALTDGRPTANASGGEPYVIAEGDSLSLDGSASSDPEMQPLLYEWDLDGDGVFGEPGEVTGANPLVSWATLQSFGIRDDGSYQIGLRVTDVAALSETTTTTLTVVASGPTINVSGAGNVAAGALYTLNFSASDIGEDPVIGWTINWGDGTIDQVGDVTTATHVYTDPGFTRSITVSVEDQDGTWTNSDLLVGSWRSGADAFHRFDGSTGDFASTAPSTGELDRPYAITVGPDGSYYVSGYSSNSIGRYDAGGSYLGEIIASGTAGLDEPSGLAFGADGNLYVANYGGNNILRFDASGSFIDVFGSGGGGMNGPVGLAFGPDGDLYASSWNNGRLMKYDGVNGGSAITVIGSGLARPEQIAFDSAGNLYIADGPNDSVRMWDGSSLTTYFSHPSLNYAAGLAFGPDGALYVSSYNNDQILRYDGSTTEIFVDPGSGSLDQPEHIFFTPELQVRVTSTSSAPSVTAAATEQDVQSTSGLVIDRNAADGPEVTHFKISGITNGTLYLSDGITVVNDGDFITYAEGNAGLRFTPSPGYIGPVSFDVQASSTGDDLELSAVTTAAIAVTPVNLAPSADASGGAPYVIGDNDSLSLDGSRSYDPEGQALTYEWDLDNDGIYGEPGEPTGLSPVVAEADLANFGVDGNGTHVIGLRVTDGVGKSDTTTASVWIGNTTQTISVTGAASSVEGDVYTLSLSAQVPGSAPQSWTINWGDGQIDTVGDVTSATHTYTQPGYTRSITVSVSTEIGTWTNSELAVGTWQPGLAGLHIFDGTTGDSLFAGNSSGGLIQRPSTIVLGPDGSYYVSGHDSNNIGRFDTAGGFLGQFIAPGTGGLSNPDGLAFDAAGNLYVANAGANNILRFDASGTFMGVFGAGVDISGPTGLAFAPNGDLYVASWGNGKILKLDGVSGGTPITVIDTGLTQPEELAFDASGNLYIADGGSSSVLLWDGSSLTTYFSDPSLVYATGLTFGPDGSLYVASHNNNRIVRFDGAESQIFVPSGSAGLSQPEYLVFTPELQVHVTHRAEVPSVTTAITAEDVQSTSGLVLDRNAADGPEVTHFKISGITNGILYQNDGTTVINDGDFITWAEGNAGLRFTPSPDYFGPAHFDVQASTTGDDSNLSTATTADITVTPVNDAPVLDASGTMRLTDVVENDSDPAGSSVASIVASAGGDRITDLDPAAIEGIAVIGVDDTNGTWEYSTDGGGSWSSFAAQGVPSGSIDDTAAVLLADDALIRFVPAPGYSGSAGQISFHAWDQSSGSNGATSVNVSANGGSTPFSTDSETASLTVVDAADVTHLVPGSQNVDEDTALVFSSGAGNAITVSDGSSSDLVLQTRLSVSNGTLTLATTTGLSFLSGADGTSSMIVIGTESAINTALDGLSFTPDADYAGPADLQLRTHLSDPSLLGLYTFDDPGNPAGDEGTLPADDGTPNGGVGTTFDAARGSDVMDFDGSDDRVMIPGLYGEPPSVTLAGWVNLDSGFFDDEMISLGSNVGIRLDATGVGNGVTGFFWDGSAWQDVLSNVFVNGTGWHHIAYSIDDANDLQTLYMDGAPVAASAATQSISYTIGINSFLGQHGLVSSYNLHGKLDDVQIYDRALADAEITALFSQQTSAADTVAITVNPANDAPQGSDGSVSTAEDTPYSFTAVDFGFSDPVEGDSFARVVITTAPGAGTLLDGSTVLGDGDTVSAASIAAGNLVFAPGPDANGVPYASFTFQVEDDGGTLNGGQNVDLTPNTITIDVTPVNDGPLAVDDTAVVAGGGMVLIDLAANDSDVDSLIDLSSIQIVSGPANGLLAVNPDGTVAYTHDGSETPSDSFTYTIRDTAGALSNPATVDLTVTPVNDAPTASDDFGLVGEGNTVTIDLAANDSDADSLLDLTSIQIVSAPSNGSLVVNPDGTVVYTHDGSESLFDSFTYTISDVEGLASNEATVLVGVWPSNDAPIATDDSATVMEGGMVTIDLAANDSDPDSPVDLASLQIVSGPASGSLVVNPDGTVDYTHNGDEATSDSFTYTIRDGWGALSNTSTVSLTVTPVNDAPVAADDSATADEGGSITIDLAVNDSDVDGSLDLTSIQIVSGPASGSLVVNPDGTVVYTHDGGVAISDSFTYTVRDDAGALSNTATVSLTITPVNDAPVAADDIATVDEGGSTVIDLATNDSDIDSPLDLTSIQIVSAPANGAVVVNLDGTVVYTHNGGETLSDSFTYTIRDSAGAVSNTATVSLTIRPANDAPSGADAVIGILEDAAYVFTAADFGFSDPVEGDSFAGVLISTDPTAGTLRDGATILNGGDFVSAASIAAGNLVFAPAANASGAGYSSFDFQVRDTGGTLNGGIDLDVTPKTITIDVTPLNDAPTLSPATPTLGTITEDAIGNPGQTVASILGTSVSDIDTAATEGIAITRLASGNGTWQYSTDGGSSWAPVGPVGSSSALLLRDADLIRFVPDGENADSASFDFRAWDRTSGVFATTADATLTGASSAFSNASDTARITVTAVNDAPGLGDASLAPVPSNAVDPPGEAITGLFAGRFSDIDNGAGMAGIAVVGNGSSAGPQGEWQYSSDGGSTWFGVGSVADDSSALALDASTRLRFMPAGIFGGAPPSLSVRALDDSYAGGFSSTVAGSEVRSNVDTGSNGGASAISGGTASLSTQITNAINLGTPDLDPPPGDPTGPPDDPDEPEEDDQPTGEPPSDSPDFGYLPDLGDDPFSSNGGGGSSHSFTPSANEVGEAAPTVLSAGESELRARDSRAEKAETRSSSESRGEGLSLAHGAADLMQELDRLRNEVAMDSVDQQRVVGSSIALTAGLSIGYIVWLTRGGLLIASLVSSMPVWRLIDPVPILAGLGVNEDDPEDAESLGSMLDGQASDEAYAEDSPATEGHETRESGAFGGPEGH